MITAYYLSDLLAIGITHRSYDCRSCPRQGRYSVAGLLERYGEIPLPDVLYRVSQDCPERGKMGGRCGAKSADPLTVEQEAAIKTAREAAPG